MVYPALAGTSYRPSNSTEGMIFTEIFCDKCAHDVAKPCAILSRSMAYDTNEPEYPMEWIYDDSGSPVCTSFEQRRMFPAVDNTRYSDDYLDSGQLQLFTV